MIAGPVNLPQVFPQRPRVRGLGADGVCQSPGRAAVGADLDAADRVFPGPGDAEQTVAADAEFVAAARPDHLSLDRHRPADLRFQPLPAGPLARGLARLAIPANQPSNTPD